MTKLMLLVFLLVLPAGLPYFPGTVFVQAAILFPPNFKYVHHSPPLPEPHNLDPGLKKLIPFLNRLKPLRQNRRTQAGHWPVFQPVFFH
jgi:hypothetical protein